MISDKRAFWSVSSSGRYHGVDYHHEDFVIDGIEAGSSFVTEFQTNQWFQIDFASSLDGIGVVEVYKRADRYSTGSSTSKCGSGTGGPRSVTARRSSSTTSSATATEAPI